jgi:oligoribonuclease NrnB/cAMP/cGMP phosphodiesterase (DHH superfamily)
LLYDHHETALQLNKYDWAKVQTSLGDFKTSATLVLYTDRLKNDFDNEDVRVDMDIVDIVKQPCNGALFDFVKLVNNWDTFMWEKYGRFDSRTLNDIFGISGFDEFIEKYIPLTSMYRNQLKHNDYDIYETTILRKSIEEYISKKLNEITYVYDDVGRKVAFITCDRKDALSELGNRFLRNEDVGCSYIAIFYGTGIALRSIGDFDVSEIAKKNGGGGHKNAAGYRINNVQALNNIIFTYSQK